MYELSAVIPVTSFAIAILANGIRWLHLLGVARISDNHKLRNKCYIIALLVCVILLLCGSIYASFYCIQRNKNDSTRKTKAFIVYNTILLLVSLVEVIMFAYITVVFYFTKKNEIRHNEALLDEYSIKNITKEMKEVLSFLVAITFLILVREIDIVVVEFYLLLQWHLDFEDVLLVAHTLFYISEIALVFLLSLSMRKALTQFKRKILRQSEP